LLRVYALSPETLNRLLNRMLRQFFLVVTISFLIFGGYLASFGQDVNWPAALLITLFVSLAYFLLIFFQYRRQLRYLYSVRYEVDSSSITFKQAAHPAQRLNRADILSVEDRPDAFWIAAVDPRLNLRIPHGLARDGDEDLRRTFSSWVGVKKVEKEPRGPKVVLLSTGLAAAFAILVFVNTLQLILPLGLLIFVAGNYLEYRLKNHEKNHEPEMLRTYTMTFSFILFIIIMKSCMISISASLSR